METQLRENKMGTMPMGKLIMNISTPMMLSMLVQALYNVVDSIFVSRVSESALRAVGLAFPIQNLMIAVCGGTAVGINALVSKSLGEKNADRVSKSAANGILAEGFGYILFLLVGLFASKAFMASQTNIKAVFDYGVEYMEICCVFSFGLFSAMTFERLLQSTGKTVCSMIAQTVGALTNIILDPIMIFGLLGCPRMEVAGAALATVIGQTVGGITAIILHLCCNKEIKIRHSDFKPNKFIMGRIYKVGAPSIVMQAIGTVMTYGMNIILKAFGAAQTVFSLYFKLQSFVFMPVFGLNNGSVSIVAYNYGARNKERIYKALKIGVVISVSIMAVGLAIMQLMPNEMLALFDATDEIYVMGVPALRIISLCFIPAGASIMIGGVFQGLGNGIYSMIVSICRQLLVLLPVAYLFSLSGNVNAIWFAFPIAEVVSVTVTLILFARIRKNVINKI